MSKSLLILIFTCLSFPLLAQDDLNSKPDALVRSFTDALINKDIKTLKKICLFDRNLSLLWKGEKLSESARLKRLAEISKAKIQWLKVGDRLKLFGNIDLDINDSMINKKRKICQIRHKAYSTPIQVIYKGKKWRIKASWMIMDLKKKNAALKKQNRANYKLTIDGKIHPVHLNKEGVITLPNGQKLVIKLEKNDTQFFNKNGLSFTHSHQLKVNYDINSLRQSVRLSADFKTRFLIEVYKKSSKLTADSLQVKMLKAYQENYTYLKAQFDSKGIRDTKISLAKTPLAGKELHTMLNGLHQVDRFYTFEKADKVILIHSHTTTQEGSLYRKLKKQIFEELRFK